MAGFAALKGGQVKIDPRALADFFRSPDGPLARKMIVIGEQVKVRTIASLGGGKDQFARRFLGPTIVKRIVMASNGPHVLVGSDRVHTEPHIIRGKPLLSFNWARKGGVLVIVRSVNHPGSDFTDYLSRRLLDAALSLKGSV